MALHTIKVHYAAETRRIRWQPALVDIMTLRTAVAHLFPELDARVWQLQYIDEDGDDVTVKSTEELELANERFAEFDGVLRLSVKSPEAEDERRQANWQALFQDLSQTFGPLVGRGCPAGAVFKVRGCRGGEWTRHGGCRGGQCGPREENAAETAENKTDAAVATTTVTTPTSAATAYAEKASPARRPSPPSTSATAQATTAVTAPPAAAAASAGGGPFLGDYTPRRGRDVAAENEGGGAAAAMASAGFAGAGWLPQQWAREIQALQDMGFNLTQQHLSALLQRHHGALAGVVAELINSRDD